jgi:hypothetical protein
MITAAIQSMPRILGLCGLAFALWVLAGCVGAALEGHAAAILVFIAVPAVVIGLTGVLMLIRRYRSLAKLWINVGSGLLLVVVWTMPRSLGIDLGDPNLESPWTMLAWFAFGMLAIWAIQQLSVRACEAVDSRWQPKGGNA